MTKVYFLNYVAKNRILEKKNFLTITIFCNILNMFKSITSPESPTTFFSNLNLIYVKTLQLSHPKTKNYTNYGQMPLQQENTIACFQCIFTGF